MRIQLGDLIFDMKGRAGVVTARNPESGALTVERKGEKFDEMRVRGAINGLTSQDRKEFNETLDRVRQIKNPEERVEALIKEVERIKADPRNHILARYMDAQLTHMMQVDGYKPNEYKVDESILR